MNPVNKTNQMPVEQETPVPQKSITPPGAAAPQPFPPPPLQPATITPPGKKRFSKKLLFVVLAFMVLVGLAFVVIRFILPGLGVVKTEITWWGLWEDQAIAQSLIEEYQAANPGVTVIYQKNDKEDYRERLASSLAKGEGPDIFRIHSSWVPMFAAELAPAPSNVLSAEDFGTIFYPVAVDELVSAQGPVAIPLEYDGLAMFINEEIFTTYGAIIPTDWNDLREVARSLTIKDERGVITQSGAALGTTSNVDHWPEIVALLMLQNGANPNSPNDSAGRGAQALSFYKQFSSADGVWDDTQPSSTIAFASGRVGIYFGPSWRALEIIERNPNLKFKVLSVPQVPKIESQSRDITYASYWVEGVWAKSPLKDEAWRFLRFLSERESLIKLYENASRVRDFGEPYPRADMRELLLTDPIVGGFLKLAPSARSGYLHSRTFDGVSGINTSLAQYYEDAIGAISPGSDAGRQVGTLATGVQQVLARYGLAAPVATPSQ